MSEPSSSGSQRMLLPTLLVCGVGAALAGGIALSVHYWHDKRDQEERDARLAQQAAQEVISDLNPRGGPPKPATEEEAIRRFGKDFIDDLTRDQLGRAYRSLSAAYQKRWSRARFDKMIQQYPDVVNLRSIAFSGYDDQVEQLPDGNRYTYYYTPRLKVDRFVRFALTMVLEEGEWKVDDIEIRVDKP